MASDLELRRKWTLRAHGRQAVFIKRHQEGSEHVLMKAFLWALYLLEYPNLEIEVSIGDRYKPDLVSLNEIGEPMFWGEAGQVSVDKIRSLARRYRHTHFAIAKWNTPLNPYEQIVEDALRSIKRTAPFELLCFPSDSHERFIDPKGNLLLDEKGFTRIRF